MADPIRPGNNFAQYFDGYLQQKVATSPVQAGKAVAPNADFAAYFDQYEASKTAPVAAAPVEEASEQGVFSRLKSSFELGSASTQYASQAVSRELGAYLEETIGKWQDKARELAGLPPQELPAEQRAAQIRDTPGLFENQAQDRLTALQGFQQMQANDVTGVLSGLQYAMETVASSTPAMIPVLASGGFAAPIAMVIQAGQVNEELKARTDLTDKQRLAVSFGAGTAMASLDLLGITSIFGAAAPADIAKMALTKQLADHLSKKGLSNSAARILEAGIIEGSTEALQEAIQVTALEMSGGELQPGEIATRLREGFFGGLAAGTVLRTPMEFAYKPQDDAPVGQTAEEVGAKIDLGTLTESDLGVAAAPVPGSVDQVYSPINPVLKPASEASQVPPHTTADTGPVQQVPDQTATVAVPIIQKEELSVEKPAAEMVATQAPVVAVPNTTLAATDPGSENILPPTVLPQEFKPDVPQEQLPLSPMMQKTEDILDNALTGVGLSIADVQSSERMGKLALMIHKVLLNPNYAVKEKIPDRQLTKIASWLMDAGVPPELTYYVGHVLSHPKYRARNDSQLYETIGREIEAYSNLRFELDKVGLENTMLTFIAEPGRFGFYHYASQTIALNVRDANKTKEKGVSIGHEALHALKAVGAFNSELGARAWKILADYVDTLPDDIIQGKDQYSIDKYQEEKIAELYGQYNNVRNSKLALRRSGIPQVVIDAFEVLRKGFEVVKTWLDKYKPLKDFSRMQKPWHALEFIASGEIKKHYMPPGFAEAMETTARFERLASRVGGVQERASAKKTRQHADYYNYIVNYGWNVIQLAKKNTHIPWLQEYVEHASRWYNKKMAWLSRANETTAMWSNLGLKQQQHLAAMIFEIEEMIYRTPQEVSAGVVRKPTIQELTALMAKHQIGKPALAVYVKMRKDFDAILDELERITIRDAVRTLATSSLAQQLKTAQIHQEFNSIRNRPYFPHARFGNYTIVVTDSNGEKVYVENFHRDVTRNAARKSIEQQYPASAGFTVANSFVPQEAEIFKGLPPSFLEAIKNNLQLTPVQSAALEDLIIASSPTQAFKKKFVRQDMTPGYSKDALRSYADFFWHAANHIARLEFAPSLRGAIRSGDTDIEALTAQGVDTTKRVKMTDYLRVHLEQIMNPQVDWAALRSVGFLWWLGFNVKSALLNLTQVPLVTGPYLAAHFGDVKALAALTKTYTKVRSTYTRQTNWDKVYSPDEAAALQMGVEQGFLNESFAQQLAGIAEGSNLLRTRAGNRMHKTWLGFQQVAGVMFQTMEKVNRRVTFLAARDLALNNPKAKYLKQIQREYQIQLTDLIQNNGWTIEQATAFLAGKDAVRSTQFEYASWARPKFMQGRASAFFTFFMFTQNMLWFIQNSPGSTRYLLLLLASAGVMGLPGAEDLEALAKFIGRNLFGKEWNLEKELREMLVELTDAPPDLFIHGASRYGFGLEQLGDMTGIPLPATDLSGNLGMGSPMPVLSPLAQALGREGDFNDKLSHFTAEGIGATFGIGIGIARALSDTDANPRRWEQAMPAAAANISKAYRQWKDEAETMRGGAELIPYDRNNPEHMSELLMQGLGFRSTRASQAWDLVISKIEAAEFWSGRRSLLLSQFDLAKENGDIGDVQDVYAAMKRFNAQVPFNDLKLTQDTINRSRKQREAIRARREAGRPDAKYLTSVYKHLESIHPEIKQYQFEEPSP